MVIATLDACVLYPASLRDLLMRLTAGGLFAARWTAMIQSEWVRSSLAHNPAARLDQLERTCRLMERIDPASVVTGFESLIPRLNLPDADGRHVLAAAIKSSSSVVVTYNLADFPNAELDPYGIHAVHPDAFLCSLFDDQTDAFVTIMRIHRAALINPPKTAGQYIETIKRTSLIDLASRLETRIGAF